MDLIRAMEKQSQLVVNGLMLTAFAVSFTITHGKLIRCPQATSPSDKTGESPEIGNIVLDGVEDVASVDVVMTE